MKYLNIKSWTIFSIGTMLAACASLDASQTITVDPNTSYYTHDGWEAMTSYKEVQSSSIDSNVELFEPRYFEKSELVAHEAVQNLGLNRVRLELRSEMENPVDYYSEYTAGEIPFKGGLKYRWYHKINDNNDPFVADPAGFQFSFLDHQIEGVVLPMKRELESRGERLILNMCFVDFGNGIDSAGFISDFSFGSDPEEYAEIVVEAFKYMDAKYGFVPDALEVILEPDNTKDWVADRGKTGTPGMLEDTGEHIANCIVAVVSRLALHGYNSVDIYAPSTEVMTRTPRIFDGMLRVPQALNHIHTLSYHNYGTINNTNRQALIDIANNYGLKLGMMEHTRSQQKKYFWDDLKNGRVSAWCRWGLFASSDAVYFRSDPFTNQGNKAVPWNLSVYPMVQVFKHVRQGALQIEATGGDAIAYVNENGSYVVVINNLNDTGPFNINGLPAGTYAISSSGKNATSHHYVHERTYPDETITAGQTLSFSVTTTNDGSQRAGLLTVVQISGANMDATAPTVPGNFQVNVISDAQVDLDWSASSDANGIAHYEIYRNGWLYKSDISTTQFSDTGLVSGKAYRYQVRAVDPVGNVSDLTSELSAVTQGNVSDTLLSYTNHGTHIEITDCDTLANGGLVIPSSLEGLPVTSIAADAFSGCDQLKTIHIPEGVTSIGDNAFLQCTLLEEITLPSTLSGLGAGAFKDCSKLDSVVIPSPITAIADDTFAGCLELSSVSLPSGLLSIGTRAFENCKHLQSIALPDGLQSIGDFAFRGCKELFQINLGSALASMGKNPFVGCYWLYKITVDAGNPDFSSSNGVLYDKLQQTLIVHPAGKNWDVVIPSSVVSIADYAFASASLFAFLSFPSNLETIGDYAFSNSHGVSQIQIPETVKSIGTLAFENNSKLSSVEFLGHEPILPRDASSQYEPIFTGVDPSFTVSFYAYRNGYDADNWMGHSVSVLGSVGDIDSWITANNYPATVDYLTDHSNDGIPVLIEYALNLRVDQNNAKNLPVAYENSGHLYLDFRADMPGITYDVERSSDMMNWTTSGVTVTAPDASGVSKASVPISSGEHFLRLKVLKP